MRCAVRVAAGACAILACATLLAQAPGARPQFEVASVKPAANDRSGGGRFPMMREITRNTRLPGEIPMADPGRIRLQDWSLLDLIAAAYSVRTTQVSGPEWMADQGFDIEAKVPEGTPKGQLNAMLQSLLEERFALKAHRDTETRQGFALVVGKNGPKLKPAEPPPTELQGLTPEERQAKMRERVQAQMSAMMERLQESRENGVPISGFNTATWPSVTSAELASRLVRFAGAPVVDETGLTGKYSVTIETWKNADTPGGTVFDAVERLGLKLEPRKLTTETVIVDQVSKMPAAN